MFLDLYLKGRITKQPREIKILPAIGPEKKPEKKLKSKRRFDEGEIAEEELLNLEFSTEYQLIKSPSVYWHTAHK